MTVATRSVRPFRLTPALPGDKSITHRAYLLGALAQGRTTVTGGNRGADCLATLAAVRQLGVDVHEEGGAVQLEGTGGRLHAPESPLDLGNSGTGLRLLLGVLAGQTFAVELTGDESLRRRPVERVLGPLRAMGATAEAADDHPPVRLTGGALSGIRYRLPVPSAQVKSAVLLAGVQARGRTVVEGVGETRDHTERMLGAFGVPVERAADSVTVEGPAALAGQTLEIPGDPSAAAFYMAGAAIVPGSEVILEGVGLNPTRTKVFDVFSRMGLTVSGPPRVPSEIEPRGTVRISGEHLVGVRIEPAEVVGLIDELPAVAVAAAFAHGPTRVRGAGELRVKESNRLQAVADGLAAIGAAIELTDDGWNIEGSAGRPLPGGTVQSRHDHRIAMAFLMAGLGCRGGVTVEGDHGIETSDPFFLANLERLRGTFG